MSIPETPFALDATSRPAGDLMQPLVVFSHGQAATPTGRKITFLSDIARQAGWRPLSLDYTDLENPDERVRRLESTDLGPRGKLVLVGSSMGGYVAAVASRTIMPHGLFLMAPAVYLDWYAVTDPRPDAGKVLVTGGWNDDVIPAANFVRFARESRSELHLFDSGHTLWDVLPEIGDLFRLFLAAVQSSS